jgi:hypothetical protein
MNLGTECRQIATGGLHCPDSAQRPPSIIRLGALLAFADPPKRWRQRARGSVPRALIRGRPTIDLSQGIFHGGTFVERHGSPHRLLPALADLACPTGRKRFRRRAVHVKAHAAGRQHRLAHALAPFDRHMKACSGRTHQRASLSHGGAVWSVRYRAENRTAGPAASRCRGRQRSPRRSSSYP